MAQKETVNTFTGGMVMDTHPLTTPNNVLTNCLNGTLVTFNGNEMILQNDLGNAKIELKKNGDCVKLPEGFVPVGVTEKGGIIYVASYNPKDGICEIGSFPSPERNKTSYEQQGEEPLFKKDDLLINDNGQKITTINGTNYYPLIKGSFKIDLSNIIVKTGDQYLLSNELVSGDGLNNVYDYTIQLISTTDRNEQVIVDEGEMFSDAYKNYNNKSGKFSLLITPNKPETFNVLQILDENKITLKTDHNVISKVLYKIDDDDYLIIEVLENDIILENYTISENIFTCELYPLTDIGYVKELKQTIIVDLSSESSNTPILNRWRYFVKDDCVLLQYGFEGLLKNSEEQQVKLSLLKYSEITITTYNSGQENEYKEINFEGISISYELPKRESCIGTFYEYVYFDDEIKKNLLYLVKIEFYKDDTLINTEYRWLYTCPVFNEEYLKGNETDFNTLNLKLKFIPEFNVQEISPSNINSAYNQNLTNSDFDYLRRGITQNNYNKNIDITPVIKLEDNYNGLFSINQQPTVNISNINNEQLSTTESSDYILKPYYVDTSSDPEPELKDIYEESDAYNRFINNIDITNNDNTITVSGTIYDKIYCDRIRKDFLYSAVIAPLLVDSDDAYNYNLQYDSTKSHFLNKRFIMCNIIPRSIASVSDDRGNINWHISQITEYDSESGNLTVIQEPLDLTSYDSFQESNEANLIDGLTGNDSQIIFNHLINGKRSGIVPVIYVGEYYHSYVSILMFNPSEFGTKLSQPNSDVESHIKWNVNGTDVVLDDLNIIHWTLDSDSTKYGCYVVGIECKDDDGRIIPFNLFKKLGDNQIVASGLSNNTHTYGDIIFNILNLIYVKYESGTETYSKYASDFIYIADNIKYIESNKGKVKINVTGNINGDSSIYIYNLNKDLSNISQEISFNNLEVDNNTINFDSNFDLILNIKNDLKLEYLKLLNPVTQSKYKFLLSTSNIDLNDIVNINEADINSPLIIVKESNDKFYLRTLDLTVNSYIFDFNNFLSLYNNNYYTVDRNINNVLCLPKALYVDTDKNLRLKRSRYDTNEWTSLLVLNYRVIEEESIVSHQLDVQYIPKNLQFEFRRSLEDVVIKVRSDFIMSSNDTLHIESDNDPITISNISRLSNSITTTISRLKSHGAIYVTVPASSDGPSQIIKNGIESTIYFKNFAESDELYVVASDLNSSGIYKIDVTVNGDPINNSFICYKDAPELVIADSNSTIYPKYTKNNANILDTINLTIDSNTHLDDIDRYNFDFKLRYYSNSTEDVNDEQVTVQHEAGKVTFTYGQILTTRTCKDNVKIYSNGYPTFAKTTLSDDQAYNPYLNNTATFTINGSTYTVPTVRPTNDLTTLKKFVTILFITLRGNEYKIELDKVWLNGILLKNSNDQNISATQYIIIKRYNNNSNRWISTNNIEANNYYRFDFNGYEGLIFKCVDEFLPED